MARILLDMDGVLCNLIGKWFATYNREYGDRIHVDDLVEWGPHRVARAGKAIYKYLAQPGFFRDLEPIEGAIEGVRALLNRGHDVVIVTAARRGHRDKLAWVAEHLPFLPRDNIVFTHRKELVRGDVLFDDAPHNLKAFAAYGLPVAMAYRYNVNVDCVRVPDWPSFLALVDRLFPLKAAHPAKTTHHRSSQRVGPPRQARQALRDTRNLDDDPILENSVLTDQPALAEGSALEPSGRFV